VAAFVAAVEEKRDPPARQRVLRGDAKKQAFELSVFDDFAEAAPFPVESRSNGAQGYPDILCRIDGTEYWFELGRITDEILTKLVNSLWPGNPKPFRFGQEEPLERIIKKKAKKKYKTDGRPVDLVLHFNQQPPDTAALQQYAKTHIDALADLTRSGPFSRVWIYDGWSKSVLWRSAD
jgi:hypothetical protein